MESSKKWPDLAGVLILVLHHFPYLLLCRAGSAWSLQRNDLTWPAFQYLSYTVSLIHSYVEQKNLAWVCVESSKKWPDLASFSILVLHGFPYSLLCRAKTLSGSGWSPQRNDLTWPAFQYLSNTVSHIHSYVEQKTCLCLREVLKEMTWPGQRFNTCLTRFPIFTIMSAWSLQRNGLTWPAF